MNPSNTSIAMKKPARIAIALWLFLASSAIAQEAGTTMNLDECISYALENSVSIRNARLDEQIAVAKVRETVGIGLPQVNGEVQLVHNKQLARFFSRYSTAQGFGGFDENGDPNINIPGLDPNDVVASQNFFQLKSSGSANLSVSQLIFNGSYIVGLQASKTYKELSIKQTQQTQEQVVANVTKAYYSVLINRERMKLFDNNIARVDSLLRTTQALLNNGFAEEIELDRIQVSRNNLETERDKFNTLYELTLALLKFQMHFPLDQKLDIPMQDLSVMASTEVLIADQQNWSYEDRADYQVLLTQEKLQRLDIKNRYAASVPSLGAFAQLGFSTQSPTFGALFTTQTNLTDNGTIGPDKWYPTTLFGVSLSVPLFSGLQRNYQVQQSKLVLRQVENGFEQLEQAINLEVTQAAANYQNSIKSLQSQQANVRLAEKVAMVTNKKYAQGLGSNLEVIDAESSLKESQINYYNALLDALLNKVEIDRAKGQLIKK